MPATMTDSDARPATAVAVQALTKTYGHGAAETRALTGVDLTFAVGTLSAVMGPAGSGKSTLLNCMGGRERLTSGTVLVEGEEIAGVGERRRARMRRAHFGFVSQPSRLMSYLSAEQDRPQMILADEPTDGLDSRAAREVLVLLRASVDGYFHGVRRTVVMVTRDPVAASLADRVVFLANGRVVGTMDRPTVDAVATRLVHLAGEVA